MTGTLIVVEGPADRKFITDLVKYRLKITLTRADIFELKTNGRSIGDSVFNLIKSSTNSLRKPTCFILDNDRASDRTRDKVTAAFDSRGMALSTEQLFLVPNDQDEGNLETLLLPIVSSTHGDMIFSCYQDYYQCLGAIDSSFGVEDPKEKLYVYSKLLSDEGNETKRDYLNSEVWNLDHPSLDPLVRFLHNHLSA